MTARAAPVRVFDKKEKKPWVWVAFCKGKVLYVKAFVELCQISYMHPEANIFDTHSHLSPITFIQDLNTV